MSDEPTASEFVAVYRWAVLENMVTLLVAAWLTFLVSPWCLFVLINLNNPKIPSTAKLGRGNSQ